MCIGLALPGVALSDAHGDNASVSLYGRLWPKVTYTSPSDGDPSTDITDALSRLGVSADYKLSDTLSAIAQAEVRVNLDRDGDSRNNKYVGLEKKDVDYFLTEHLGYVGLQSSDLGLLRHRHAVEPVLQHRRRGDRRVLPPPPAPSAMTTRDRSVKSRS